MRQVEQLLRSIEAETGLPCCACPCCAPRIDTGFDLRASQSHQRVPRHWAQTPLQPHELPLACVGRARACRWWTGPTTCRMGQQLGPGVDAVLAHPAALADAKTLAAFGVVVRHHELGYDRQRHDGVRRARKQVDACGEALAQVPASRSPTSARAPAAGLQPVLHGAWARPRGVRATVAQAVAQAGWRTGPAMLFLAAPLRNRPVPGALPRTTSPGRAVASNKMPSRL